MPSQPVVYVYVLEHRNGPPAVFTWPNILRKYLKDIYADPATGELILPPEDHRPLIRRVMVNPKPGRTEVIHGVDYERFLGGKPY